MRILLLDADMPTIDAPSAEFSSNHSVYDYDIVLWSPLESLRHYLTPGWGAGSYKGRRRLSDEASAHLRQDVARRGNEFEEFLRLGRTLVVFLPSDLRMWTDTGRRNTSGTGKNAKSTTIVELTDITEALPLQLEREYVTGTEMEPAHSSIGPLYRQTKDFWSYASVFKHRRSGTPPSCYWHRQNRQRLGFAPRWRPDRPPTVPAHRLS